MIIAYSFAQYLKNQFPAETIYLNGRHLISGQEEIPDRNVLINDTGGSVKPAILYIEKSVQIICRDVSKVGAMELSYNIYEDIKSRFGLLLPETVVNGITYASKKVAQISAIQQPYYIGEDDQGRTEYVNNYQIIFLED